MTVRIVEGEDSDRAVAAMAAEWVEANRERVDALRTRLARMRRPS